MRHTLALLSGLIAIAGAVPYILDTIKGKTRPNVVTWFTWTLLNGINAAAAFSDGAIQTAIFSVCAFVATGMIVALGLRQGIKHYTRFDICCQIVALLGIALWLLTSQPALAVLIVLVVDFAGGLPTLRHAWRAPGEETLPTFISSVVSTSLLLATLVSYTFVSVAMPLYILLYDITIIAIIVARRRSVRATTKHPNPAA